MPPMNEITRVLYALEQGDPHAAEQLLPLVYEELRKLAAHKMAQEAPGHTLQPTALVRADVYAVLAWYLRHRVELHFEGLAEDGDPIPQPGGVDAYRTVMKDLDLDRYFLAHVQIDTSRFATPASHS
jgi:hypothetical protein